ncbi:MAG: ferredoxin [Candidatus Natronoplasma sp.]
MFKIEIDQETCIGCGTCSAICPEIFELDEENKSQIVEKYREENANIGKVSEDIGCAGDAEKSCPVDAIKIS